TIRADGAVRLPVPWKEAKLPHVGRPAGGERPPGGRGPEAPLTVRGQRVLNGLPRRRLRQQAWLERLGVGVRQQELGGAEAELAGTVGGAGGRRRGFLHRSGRGAGRDAREGDLLVA